MKTKETINSRMHYSQSKSNYIFKQFPTFLYDPKFSSISVHAKFLYMHLYNLNRLSMANKGFHDKRGHIYVLFPREEMAELLQVCAKTASNYMNELKKHGLVDEVQQGKKLSNLIYVLDPGFDEYRYDSPKQSTPQQRHVNNTCHPAPAKETGHRVDPDFNQWHETDTCHDPKNVPLHNSNIDNNYREREREREKEKPTPPPQEKNSIVPAKEPKEPKEPKAPTVCSKCAASVPAPVPPVSPPPLPQENAPQLIKHGEYGNVYLSEEDYIKLADKYGEAMTKDFIAQLDRAIAIKPDRYAPNANHRAIIERWILRDQSEKNRAVPSSPPYSPSPRRQNRFVNFKQRERDFAELERLERQHVLDNLDNTTEIPRKRPTG